MKNTGNFLKVHKIEQSTAIDEVLLPKDFIKKLSVKEIMSMSITEFRSMKDKPLYMVKNQETQEKIEKLLG